VLEDTRLSPRYPTDHWPKDVVVGETYLLPLDPSTPPGDYQLQVTLSVAGKGGAVASGELPVQLPPQAAPLVPALDEMAQPVGVSFGGELRLLGLSAAREGGTLRLDLYWLAERAPEDKYKFFVHLVHTPDGSMTAQYDGMPRGWSYPTDLWGRGEVYREQVELDVSQAPRGPHHLALGVYGAETGRLAAVGQDGERLPDDQAMVGIGELGQ
jgi:hypothetical protein